MMSIPPPPVRRADGDVPSTGEAIVKLEGPLFLDARAEPAVIVPGR